VPAIKLDNENIGGHLTPLHRYWTRWQSHDQKLKFLKFKMAAAAILKIDFLAITHRPIVRCQRNFVWGSRTACYQGLRDKKMQICRGFGGAEQFGAELRPKTNFGAFWAWENRCGDNKFGICWRFWETWELPYFEQEAQPSQRDRATLRVIVGRV